jgi:CBS domain-containing protein
VRTDGGFYWKFTDATGGSWYWHPEGRQWTGRPQGSPTAEAATAGLNPDAPTAPGAFHHHEARPALPAGEAGAPMSETPATAAAGRSPLAGLTAADLMTPHPVSLHGGATAAEVVAFLTDTGYSAAPVIDDAGRPIGVVSRSDVLVYDGARAAAGPAPPEAGAVVRASDLMTPEVFAVAPEAPAAEVAGRMADLNVHRLFVVGRGGALVGVISALDLLQHLRP